MTTCALCGDEIVRKDMTDEHVPPKLYYPKSMRGTIRAPFWTVPSHRSCNEKYRMDEEYLYHFMLGMVANQNPAMGRILLDDLRARAKNDQTRGLIRRILGECQNVTPGGIHLPPGHYRIPYNIARIQNVAIKIAQCLYFLDHRAYLPRNWCKHFELCESPRDLQPLFDLMRFQKPKAIAREIFCYRHVCVDGTHLYSLLLWQGFMFCLAFDDPCLAQGHQGDDLVTNDSLSCVLEGQA